MDSPNSLLLSLLSFSFFVCCSSGSLRRELIQTTQHDFTAYPTSPVTNPVTGGITTPPPVITVPSANPVTPIPFPPATDPNNPPVPVTNPVTTPSTGVAPPAVVPGQSWCVARGGVPESVIQVALDYACGIGGADCSAIQQGANCYNPNSLQNHASYAFNSYYQRNPVQTSCDFGGAAMLTNVNPSSGSCIFTTSSSSSSSSSATLPPATTTPIPTPSTDPSYGAGTPPALMNASNPAFGMTGGFGEIPPTATTSSARSLKPFFRCIIIALVSIITLRI